MIAIGPRGEFSPPTIEKPSGLRFCANVRLCSMTVNVLDVVSSMDAGLATSSLLSTQGVEGSCCSLEGALADSEGDRRGLGGMGGGAAVGRTMAIGRCSGAGADCG